jgi:hypothetical protein
LHTGGWGAAERWLRMQEAGGWGAVRSFRGSQRMGEVEVGRDSSIGGGVGGSAAA